LCGKESLHRAMLSIAGRRKTILLCDDCNQKVIDDQPTLGRVMDSLNRD
jgi:hypothetical protein